MMGSRKGEKGRSLNETFREVTLTYGFWLMETLVTQAIWRAFEYANPSYFSLEGPGKKFVEGLDTSNFPVESVSWEACQKFIGRLNQLPNVPEGFVLRLPTEAEFEYACRAGTTSPFPCGALLDSTQANFDGINCDVNRPYGGVSGGRYLERTSEVGSYPPNAWGLCDMIGNVYDWCADEYVDPTGATQGEMRVIRGGSWLNFADHCRSASRHGYGTRGSYHIGFRLVLGRKE